MCWGSRYLGPDSANNQNSHHQQDGCADAEQHAVFEKRQYAAVPQTVSEWTCSPLFWIAQCRKVLGGASFGRRCVARGGLVAAQVEANLRAPAARVPHRERDGGLATTAVGGALLAIRWIGSLEVCSSGTTEEPHTAVVPPLLVRLRDGCVMSDHRGYRAQR